MRKYLLLTLGCLLLLGCKQEVLESEQMIQGKFVLDDGSGLTGEYLEFKNGHLTIYTADLYPFVEGKIWHTNGSHFQPYRSVSYIIQEGNLRSSIGTLNGPIEQKDGVLTVGGEQYTTLTGFDANPYSKIIAEQELTFNYTEQDFSIPYTIERPIPAGETSVLTNNSQWITNLKVEDGAITGHLSATSTDRSGSIKLSYTQASDVWVTVKQVPSSFIKATPESFTVEYTASTQTLVYTIENPLATSTLAATSTVSWITDIQVSGTQVTFKVGENNYGSTRNGAITLSYVGAPDVTIPVIQKWSASGITLTPSSQTVDYSGGSFSFDYVIDSPREGVSVTAASLANWITNVALSGNTISYKVSENNSGAQRSGKIKLSYGSYATVEFTVTQNWTASSITMTPSSQTADYTGGSFSFDYAISNPREGVLVTAASQANWITDVKQTRTTISYKVAENNSGSDRTSKIKLTYGSYATAEFTVTQTGKPVVSLTLNKSELALLSGASETLIATVDPTDAPLQWSSNKTSVATVEQSGKVTAIGNGTATITVKAGEKTATCVVMVTVMPEAVDLGLPSGLKWASLNLGASRPEEFGDYYAWGDTEPYYEAGHSKDKNCTHWRFRENHPITGYNWESYKWGTMTNLTKYCTISDLGVVDNITELQPVDDAARQKLGGKWRMPTEAEWEELISNCNRTVWTTYNGVNGCKFTSKKNPDNWIFLPAAGLWRNDSWLGPAGSSLGAGRYWSASLKATSYDADWYVGSLSFGCSDYVGDGRLTISDAKIYHNSYRSDGLSVRPVSE